MNTYAPSGCTFVYGREGELLARLGPEQRPRALLEGMPPAHRVLTEEESAWLGTWVPSEGVQHLDKRGLRVKYLIFEILTSKLFFLSL